MFRWAAFFSLSSSESWMTFWGLGYHQVTSIPCDIHLTSHMESKEDTTLENAFKVEASMALWRFGETRGYLGRWQLPGSVSLAWKPSCSFCVFLEMLKYNNVKKMTCEKFQNHVFCAFWFCMCTTYWQFSFLKYFFSGSGSTIRNATHCYFTECAGDMTDSAGETWMFISSLGRKSFSVYFTCFNVQFVILHIYAISGFLFTVTYF